VYRTYDVAEEAIVRTEAVPVRAKSNRIPYLDGWRGLALAGVLIDHFLTNRGINTGWMGVEMFFVLSGRLMAEILFIRGTPLPNFFARRVSRVYPALAALAVCVMLVAALAGGPDPTFGQFVSSITFTANYTRLWIGESKVLGHVWTLCIEEHMYFLLGLVALAWRRWHFPLVGVLATLAIVFMLNGAIETIFGLSYQTVYWRSDARGASILVGAIAYLLLRRDVPPMLSGPWVPVILGVVGVVLSFKMVPDPIKYSIATACLATSLVLMTQAPAFILRILEHPLLLRAGLWSYSIYLWQQPFFRLAKNEGIPRWWLLPVGIAAGIVSFYTVEQPARRWLNAHWNTHRDVVKG
jgi:peptidoglycan/LPS O-acetylase OafA/YrhL